MTYQPPPQPPQQPYPPQYQQPGPPPGPYGPPPMQPPAGWQPPPPEKASPRKLALIFGALGVVVVGLFVIGTLTKKTSAPESDGVSVQLTSCDMDSAGIASAKVGLTIKNGGDRERDVRVELEYRDSSGARIDTDTVYVRNVAAGDTVRHDETTLLDAPPSGQGRCVITSTVVS